MRREIKRTVECMGALEQFTESKHYKLFKTLVNPKATGSEPERTTLMTLGCRERRWFLGCCCSKETLVCIRKTAKERESIVKTGRFRKGILSKMWREMGSESTIGAMRNASFMLLLSTAASCMLRVGAAGEEQCIAHHERDLFSRPQIILFGDSITQHGWGSHGWATELSTTYVRKADVYNRGFSGYNSAVAL